MNKVSIKDSVLQNVSLCVERGWRANFYFADGQTLLNAFITAEDLGAGAIVVERPGERHLKPRLIRLEELDRVDIIWG